MSGKFLNSVLIVLKCQFGVFIFFQKWPSPNFSWNSVKFAVWIYYIGLCLFLSTIFSFSGTVNNHHHGRQFYCHCAYLQYAKPKTGAMVLRQHQQSRGLSLKLRPIYPGQTTICNRIPLMLTSTRAKNVCPASMKKHCTTIAGTDCSKFTSSINI